MLLLDFRATNCEAAKQIKTLNKEANRGDLREVQRVEEEDDVLALVLLEGDLLELAIDDGSGLEGGGNLSNGGDHFDICVCGGCERGMKG